ncbi:MAG: alpha-amylase family protein [Anaerolineales bacterium]|nr:alpha-amylase family protein [Anaerolineales bacterium]
MIPISVQDQIKEQVSQDPTFARLYKYRQNQFFQRLEVYWDDLIRPLHHLYGHLDNFEPWLTDTITRVGRAYAQRPHELQLLDEKRLLQPDWYQKSNMLGYVAYTDRFADNLNGVVQKIEYLNELGVTYLHLMPLLQPRLGANDGGYAVMDYRQVNARLGSMKDLANLATQLRHNNISLCIDLVCNHTAKEHEWAKKARAGNPDFQNYYLMFPNQTLPNAYEETLREIFPDFKAGNFTYYEDLDKWVWTTFNEYQWDLNYQNPAVFTEMLEIMLYLANQGVEILRLDAVAFMWKRLGTDCENQPEAHLLLQAFRALSRLAAPGLLLKAEAIVSPPQLIPYLGRGVAANKECHIAYHNVLMVMLWSCLAERKAVLATKALQNMPPIPSGTSWVTYVRCHDDIGWAITEEDAAEVGLDGFAHRAFLSDFYTGRFEGTFAAGTTFQFNPKNNDRRVNGSLASLAGLETAVTNANWSEVAMAIRRILLLHNLIVAYGGIPLIYMGDEIGLLNDHSYLEDDNLANDSRWIHRPFMDWQKAEERHDPHTITGRIYSGLCQLIEARQRTEVLHAETAVTPIWPHNDHVLGLLRHNPRGRLLILANVTEQPQTISRDRLRALGFHGLLRNRLDEQPVNMWHDLTLEPYQVVWLQQAS